MSVTQLTSVAAVRPPVPAERAPAFTRESPPTATPERPAAVYAEPVRQMPPTPATYKPPATPQGTDWASGSLVASASGTIIAIAYGQPVMLTQLDAPPQVADADDVLPSGPRPAVSAAPRVPTVKTALETPAAP